MKKRVYLFAALLAASGGAAQAAQPDLVCPAERAVYLFESEYGTFRADFTPAAHYASYASGLYLRITSPQRPYWFKFSVSNGYSVISAMPISDPYAEDAREDGPRELLAEEFDDPDMAPLARATLATLAFYSFNADLTALNRPPDTGVPAPAYFLMPAMGSTLWYAPRAISEDPMAMRDPMSVGMFRLAECRDEPLPEAFP